MTLFSIIRHGETDFNKDGRYQGQTEIPLNATGRLQSQALAGRMAKVELDVIYSSDLIRAQETARLIAHGRQVLLDPRLREIDVGRVAGLTDAEIARREPAFARARQEDEDRTPFPGGESALDVQRRALEVFEQIHRRYPAGRVAVVTHGGLIKMVVAAVLGLPVSLRHRVIFGNCGLTVVEWGPERRRVRALNDTGHLVTAPGDLLADL